MKAQDDVTRLLRRWHEGEPQAEGELLDAVYGELRRLASGVFRRAGTGDTLQPTALVHEAYLRLVRSEVTWRDRLQFFAFASTVMRRILVDHARHQTRQKRGGPEAAVPLEDVLESLPLEAPNRLVHLDEALSRLEEAEPRVGRVLELHYFGGLNYDEIAEQLEISKATVSRDLRFGRAWLQQELAG